MISFPEEFELMSLFESEPELLDGSDKPWIYNEVKFTAIRGDDKIVVQIYASFGQLSISWEKNGNQQLRIKLIELDKITVEKQYRDEFLTAVGTYADKSVLLKLRLKPSISVEFEEQRV